MKLKPFFLSLSALACAALAVLPACSNTSDASKAGQVAPSTPTAPTISAPAKPTAPIAPTAPTAPTAPVAPAAPTAPTAPIAPVKPEPPAVAQAAVNVADETPKAEPRAKDRNWVARQTLLNERAQAGGFDVMFLGDSITHSWEPKGEKAWYEKLSPFRPQNFGISGDQTSHVLWRLQNGNLDGKADPKLVVLMIGTNDTGSKKPAQRTANGVKAILDEIQKRKPAAKILLLAVFPRGHLQTDGLRVKNDEINTLIAAFADNQKIFFKDINKIFLTEDGKLERKVMPDFLHPNADSYALWADAIVPDIKAILGADYTQGPVLQVPPPPAPTAPPAESRVREKYWKDRQVLLNQRAQDGGFDVMFIGDSITHNWEEDYLGGGKEPWAQKLLRFKPANFGIGADQTGHVLWRLQNGNLDGKADPKVVVLMIGTNDTGLGRKAPARTALGVKAIIDEIHKRKPAAKILLLGIFPRSPSATSAARVTNNKINDIIKTYADDKVVFYKDIGSLFLEEDGKISLKLMPDKLHLTTEGYHLWADAIIPDIEKLLAKVEQFFNLSIDGFRRNFFTLFEDMSTNPPDPKRPSRRNQKTDAEWAEIVDAYKRGLSLSQIKKKWSVGDVTLHKRIRLLVEAGELPPPPPPRRLDWEKVAKDYQNYTVPMRVIAKWHNVSLETLGALITRRRASGRWNVPSRQEVLNWNWDLVKQYFASGLTLPEIAKKVGRSEAMLYRRVYQFWADGVWPVAFVPKRGKRKKTTPEK